MIMLIPTSRPIVQKEVPGRSEEQRQYRPQRASFLKWPSHQAAVQIVRFVRDQDDADDNREQGRHEGPPEPRRLPRPVGCHQPNGSADEKEPAQNDGYVRTVD